MISVAVLCLMLTPQRASAAEDYKCWHETVRENGARKQLLHCRIDGSDVIVYTDGDEPDVPLFPAVGNDGDGSCHYRRSQFTGWYLIQVSGTDNLLQYDPDGVPGGPRIADSWFRRCDGEPWEIEIEIEQVWEIVDAFDFAVPDPVLTPDVGVTGLPTFIEVHPPPDIIESLTSPITGALVEVEFSVSGVAIDWGDDEIQEVPPALFAALSGYPDGEITHTFETKALSDVAVDYVWLVRWRVDGSAWEPIGGIDPTTWTGQYQVDEVVGRRTG